MGAWGRKDGMGVSGGAIIICLVVLRGLDGLGGVLSERASWGRVKGGGWVGARERLIGVRRIVGSCVPR